MEDLYAALVQGGLLLYLVVAGFVAGCFLLGECLDCLAAIGEAIGDCILVFRRRRRERELSRALWALEGSTGWHVTIELVVYEREGPGGTVPPVANP